MIRRATRVALCLALALAAAPGAAAQTTSSPRLLRVGTSGDYAPFSLRSVASPDAGQVADGAASYSGFDIEVARRFAADRGYRVEFVPFEWPELARDLEARRFDVAMSGITMRGDRSVLGRFTVPVAATRAIALSWRGAHATVARQLDRRDRRIAVNAGGYLEGVARKVFPAARIIALSDNDAVRMAMLDRWTDAVVTDNLEEKQWTKGVVGVVRIGPLSDDRKAYLVRSDREELAAELDLWLLAHERDGSLARLRKELLGETDLTPVAAPLPALINTIDERMAIMPLVWAAKRKAQSPIEDKAQEARVLRAAAVAVSQAARAASRPVPDAEQTRALFEALMDAGKDTQRAAATSAASDSPPTTIPEFDLETRIRPALGRITAKLASLLVALAALEVPLTAEAVQRPLATALADYRLRAANVEAMSSAIAALSATDTAHAPR